MLQGWKDTVVDAAWKLEIRKACGVEHQTRVTIRLNAARDALNAIELGSISRRPALGVVFHGSNTGVTATTMGRWPWSFE